MHALAVIGKPMGWALTLEFPAGHDPSQKPGKGNAQEDLHHDCTWPVLHFEGKPALEESRSGLLIFPLVAGTWQVTLIARTWQDHGACKMFPRTDPQCQHAMFLLRVADSTT